MIAARRERGHEALARLDDHLFRHDFLVDSLSAADVAVFAYTHVAGDAVIDLATYPHVATWIARVKSLPRFIDDFVPDPDNARPDVSRSIYD